MSLYYYPSNTNLNEYVKNFKGILSERYTVKTIGGTKDFFEILKSKDKDVLFLNWFEDVVSSKKLFMYILGMGYFLLLRLQFKKIIWVRHNLKPHNHLNMLRYKLTCSTLKFFCDDKVTHRPMLGYKFVPHPTYSSKDVDVSNGKREVEYLYFGLIKKYKGLVELLNVWEPDFKLVIRGYCDDVNLYKDILDVISRRDLNVDYVNGYVDADTLNELLLNTKFVIIPHVDKSMIVSGAFYHAASFGTNFVLMNSDFSKYLINDFKFTNYLSDMRRPFVEPVEVCTELESKCGKDVILKHVEELIG